MTLLSPKVIISGLSSPGVLTDKGFLNYAQAIGFSTECLGIHLGNPQTANLGDGHGWLNQTIELREDFWNDEIGTCVESAIGGNHFRMWRQSGPGANSGALFLAASWEKPAKQHHDIVPDGYDVGRDALVRNAIGTVSHKGVKYNTVVQNVTGLLPLRLNLGSIMVCCHLFWRFLGTLTNVFCGFLGIAQDGITTLLTVQIVSGGTRASEEQSPLH